jgi:four helix bundle protein
MQAVLVTLGSGKLVTSFLLPELLALNVSLYLKKRMKSYRDLEVYKESKRLAIEVHKLSLSLPKFELYEEGSQIRRSSKSVTSTIVEGYGRRRYKAEFIKYLVYAQSECDETIVHLHFLFETESLKGSHLFEKLKQEYDILSKKINKFIQWVEDNWNDFPNKETGNISI